MAKFSLYSSSPAVEALAPVEVKVEEAEVALSEVVISEAVLKEEEGKAATKEDEEEKFSAADIAVEESPAKESVAASAAVDGIIAIKDAVKKETVAKEGREKDTEDEEVESDNAMDISAHKTCQEESPEDLEEEETCEEDDIKGEVTASSSNVSEAMSEASELSQVTTNTTAFYSAAASSGSTPMMSGSSSRPVIEYVPCLEFPVIESIPSTESIKSAATTMSGKLETMMFDRIAAIDNIRNLLEQELEQDNDLIAEFTGAVVALTDDVGSKNTNIESLNKHVIDLQSKNDDYAQELSKLSSTVNELADANQESLDQLVKCEEENSETIGELTKTIEDLTTTLEKTKSCYTTKLEAKTDACTQLAEEIAGISKQLDDEQLANVKISELHASLEAQVNALNGSLSEAKIVNAHESNNVVKLTREIQDVRKEFSQEKENNTLSTDSLQMLLTDTTSKYHDKVKQNKQLKSTVTNMEASATKLCEEHKATMKGHESSVAELIAGWERQLKGEKDANTDLAKMIIHLEKKLEDEHVATLEITQLHTSLECQIESTKKLHNREKDQLTNQLEATSDMVVKMDEKITSMISSHAEDADKSACTIALLEKDVNEECANSKKVKKGFDAMKKKYHKEIERSEFLRIEQEDMVTSADKMAADHNAAVNEMKEEHKAAVEKLSKEIEGIKAVTDTKAKAHNFTVEGMEEEHKAEVEELTNKIDETAEEHMIAVKGMKEDHKAAVEKLLNEIEDMKMSAEKIDEEHRTDAKGISEQHTDAVDGMITAHKATVDDFKAKLQTLRNQFEKEQSATCNIAERYAAIESKLESTKKSNKKELSRLVHKFQKELEEMRIQLENEKTITVQLKELQERLTETEQHLSTTSMRKDTLSEKLGEVQSLNAELKAEVAESKSSQAEMLQRVSKLLERLDNKEDSLSKVTAENIELVEEITKMQGFSTQLTSEVTGLKEGQAKAAYEINKLAESLEEKDAILSSLTSEKNDLVEKVDHVQDEFADSGQKLTELKRENQALFEELNESQSIKSRDSLAWVAKERSLTSSLLEAQKSLEVVSNERTTLEISLEAMMDHQRRLEHMLRDSHLGADSGENENSMKKTKKQDLALDVLKKTTSGASSIPRPRSSSKPKQHRSSARVRSRPRNPLSLSTNPPLPPRQPVSPTCSVRSRRSIDP